MALKYPSPHPTPPTHTHPRQANEKIRKWGVLTGISERRAVVLQMPPARDFPSPQGVCSAQCELAGAGKREKRAWHRPGSPHSEKPAGEQTGDALVTSVPGFAEPKSAQVSHRPRGESQPPGCLRSCPRGPPGGLNRLRRRRWREQGMLGPRKGPEPLVELQSPTRRKTRGETLREFKVGG